MKLSASIFLISTLIILGCTNKLPEPEVKKDLPEINATISGEVWTPQYAGAVVSNTENLGGISVFIYDEAHLNSQKRNRLLQLSFTNNDFDWSPIRPINLFNTEDDFIVSSRFGENLDPFKRTYRTTEYNDAIGVEITEVREENGIYYLDGRFKSQPCYGGGDVFPNCLNIVGTFKNMRVFESYTDMSWYFKIP
ncbi:hypothetical protein [Roseivirga seohaensis]|uniref:hypothetical protein n=1 Tax=Roseivirga seohaensis TaxID=1914963 RepID=UPI00114718CE|nr:hypothetical protein [Roseivirga seohaensis]